jgi:hypothetical protein
MKHLVSAPQTVKGKFLLVSCPLACILALVLFAFLEWHAHQSERQTLQQKLYRTLDSQRAILSGPGASQDRAQVQSILAALATDPGLARVTVTDPYGKPLGSIGPHQNPIKSFLHAASNIVYHDGRGPVVVGAVELFLTEPPIGTTGLQRRLSHAILALHLGESSSDDNLPQATA